ELAVGSRFFTVAVKMYARYTQNVPQSRQFADEVHHGRMANRARAAERQPENGANVVLELARVRPFDRPMPRVVHARRHLVCDQTPALDEEFDREHTCVVEVLE